jgi:uncharacterized protein (DUF736 family)
MTVSIRADIDIVSNRDMSADLPDLPDATQGVEIGAGWIRRGENSGKDKVSLSLGALRVRTPASSQPILCRAVSQSDDNVFALIWNQSD